jgi:hypothetical protein
LRRPLLCFKVEMDALRDVFGSEALEGSICIANTKGFTGHAMGVRAPPAIDRLCGRVRAMRAQSGACHALLSAPAALPRAC